MSLTVEFMIVACGLLLAVLAPRSLNQTRQTAGRWFRRIGQRASTALLASFVIPLVILPVLTLRAGIPKPFVHDEFVYLLMGETFSRGELTNPTPEHAEHFRSPHLILEPTYQGKYPPAQSTFLAIGTWMTGQPIAGVWLSFACASAALCWMLLACVPSRWAVLGSVLFSLHPMIPVAWGETYWGGAVASLGGALLFGSILRLSRRATITRGCLLGLSLVILASSRPYEGLVVSIPAAIWILLILVSWMRARNWQALVKTALPAVLLLCTGFGLLMTYNKAVTGSPLKLPYQVWIEQNLSGSTLDNLLLDNRATQPTATGRHRNEQESTVLALPKWQFKMLRHHFFFLRIALALPLLVLPWLLRRRRMAVLAAAYVLVYLSVLSNRHSGWPHYYAPATPLLFVLIVQCLRCMSASRPRGRCLATVCAFAMLVAGMISLWYWSDSPYELSKRWVYARAEVEEFLQRQATGHILLVRYGPGRDPGDEWVWNTGLPESQQVIWAHSLGEDADRHFVQSYSDRMAWYLDVGPSDCRLRPFGSTDGNSDSDVVFTYAPNAKGHKRPSRSAEAGHRVAATGRGGTHSENGSTDAGPAAGSGRPQ